MVPEPHQTTTPQKSSTGRDMDAKACKRPSEQQTPERKKLFDDDDTAMVPTASPEKVVSPPIKQPKKRTRGAAKTKPKSKAEASNGKATENKKEAEEEECTAERGETGQGDESIEKGEKEAKTRSIRPPSEKLKKWAIDTLTEAKGDPASWFHAVKLFEGVKLAEKSCSAKWTYWQNSMYWTTRRVGVLQRKTGGGLKHVLSFGGGHCKHIGIPFVATQLFVRNLIVLRSTCKNKKSII